MAVPSIRLRWPALGALAVALAAGGWALSTSTAVRARYAAHRLAGAADAEARAAWADRLLALGDDGVPYVLDGLKSADPVACGAAAAAFGRALEALPANDPRAVALAGQFLDGLAAADGKRAAFDVLPTVLRRAGAAHAARCREVVAAGLKGDDGETRLAAVRLAMNPRLHLRAELVPLLAGPDAAVRRAALFAVGPASDADRVIGDEDLFRWLNDPDAGVRAACRDALASRGRTEPEIALGRRLAHPDAGERLALAGDLRFDDEDVRDPEPWLERLARDPDPAVRAAAARVAVERRLTHAAWVGRLAEADPDAAVRRIAAYHWAQLRAAPDGVRAVGHSSVPFVP